jgi:uncharacterized protein YgbK (DUF1537 family)
MSAASGPVFVFSGSMSPVTARQIASAHSYAVLRLDAARLIESDGAYRSEMAAKAASLLRNGSNVLACLTQGAVGAGAGGHPGRTVAAASSQYVSQVLAGAPVRRMGIAGGDTASHAVIALDAWGMSYVAQVAEGAALCRLHSDEASLDGLEIMLKGGQIGPDEIFEHLLHGRSAKSNHSAQHERSPER